MATLDQVVRRGSTVALGDGAGTPVELVAPLITAARAAGEVRLVLGFCLTAMDDLDYPAFSDVAALMGGYQSRKPIDAGLARYLPTRLATWPSLISNVLRPDVLVASVLRCDDGYRFVTESCWLWPVVDAGAQIIAVELNGPRCVAGPPLPDDRLTIVDKVDRRPSTYAWTAPNDQHRAIADRVAALVPEGARLQFAPGALGSAVVDAVTTPVMVDTGVLTEAVVALDRRGMLAGEPLSAYAIGDESLFDWVDGRAVLDRAEVTHHPGRLSGEPPLIALNTALEIDLDGQVNVESFRGSAVAGIGGQPDYMAAAAVSRGGLSILAIPTSHGGRSTLVEQLSGPVSTASHDIELIVTDTGLADLRGKTRSERRQAIAELWERSA